MNGSVIASLSPLPDSLPETHFQLRYLVDEVADGVGECLLRAVFRGRLHAEHEFVLQGVRHFVPRKENLGVPQKLAARGREKGGEGGSVGEVRTFLTYCMSMFPSVWSSLLTVNMAAFGTFVSLVMAILRQNGREITPSPPSASLLPSSLTSSLHPGARTTRTWQERSSCQQAAQNQAGSRSRDTDALIKINTHSYIHTQYAQYCAVAPAVRFSAASREEARKMSSVHLVGSSKVNVAQVMAAVQSELLQILGDANVKKVGPHLAPPLPPARVTSLSLQLLSILLPLLLLHVPSSFVASSSCR